MHHAPQAGPSARHGDTGSSGAVQWMLSGGPYTVWSQPIPGNGVATAFVA
jgi:hypothetical protein